MELEFYQELLVTAAFCILFAFLFGKITGGGFGDGERLDDALAWSDALDSRKKIPRPAVEELEEIVDCFRAGEDLLRSEQRTAWVKGNSTERSDEASCSRMEMRPDTDEVGEGTEEEINAKKMVAAEEINAMKLVAAVVSERDGAEDIKEEEEKGEGMEAELCSSDVKASCGDGLEIGSGKGEEISVSVMEESLLHGEDEWEGIEKSEMGKLFGMALEYSASTSGAEELARLSRDVQMELYGFHKVATEGPCNEPQPLPLKVSARARWHAWQKLGSMAPEIAMEQYISLLSKSIPGWIIGSSGDDAQLNRADDHLGKERLNTGHHDLDPYLQNKLSPAIERKLEGDHDLASLEVERATGGLKFLEQGTFLLNVLFPTSSALLSLYR